MQSDVSDVSLTPNPSPDTPQPLQALLDHFDTRSAQQHVLALCADTFAGRRVGTAGHDVAQTWIVEQFKALRLTTTVFPFSLDVPVLDLYALPTLSVFDDSGNVQRSLRHRTEFTPHPRSADAPALVTGIARRMNSAELPDKPSVLAGAWFILDAMPQGEALAKFATIQATAGVIGLLAPQLPNGEGFLVKRIVGQPPVALPILSVRADLLPALEGQRIAATTPIHPTYPAGGHVLGSLAGSDPALTTAPLIISAHYDGVGDDGPAGSGGDRLPCATDNAAGVAVILEVARALAILTTQDNRPRRPIVFAALDAEEANAVGSRVYASDLRAQNISPLVLNLDGAACLREALQVEPGPAADVLLAALDQGGKYLEIPLTVGAVSSDNRRFAAAGFPSAGLSVGLSGLHTPADVVQRVEPAAMLWAGTLLLATIWQLAYRS